MPAAAAPGEREIDDGLLREAVRSLLGRFGRRYFVECYRSGREPSELWQELCTAGFVGAGVPAELGGGDHGLEAVVAVAEEMARAGLPLLAFIMTELCLPVMAQHLRPEAARRIIPPIISGRRRLAFAITEADAGTNSFAMGTTATRAGDRFRVSGAKRWISSADVADDLFLVCAAGGDQAKNQHGGRRPLTILMVDLRSPGVSLERLTADAGTPERQYDVIFRDVEVPAENVVGTEGEGVSAMFEALNTERVLIAAFACGLGLHCLDRAVAYARERAPFGRPIGGYQGVQHPLAALWAELSAARALNHQAVRALGAKSPDGPGLANAAKWLASEAANRAADQAIQVHGGNGLTDEYDLVPLWKTTRLMRFAPINNEMVLNQIGRHVLGLPRSY